MTEINPAVPSAFDLPYLQGLAGSQRLAGAIVAALCEKEGGLLSLAEALSEQARRHEDLQP